MSIVGTPLNQSEGKFLTDVNDNDLKQSVDFLTREQKKFDLLSSSLPGQIENFIPLISQHSVAAATL